jgi:hypothetical protein
VTHEEHRDERHPQYNTDNMSSAQLATASAPTTHNETRHIYGMMVEEEDGHLALCRKTVSNGTTDTSSTNTITGVGVVGAAGNGDVTTLTEISLHLHQRELSQGYSPDIPRWVEGTTSFALHAHVHPVGSSMQNSMLVQSRKSKASTISSASLDREPTRLSAPSPHDVFGAGGWC